MGVGTETIRRRPPGSGEDTVTLGSVTRRGLVLAVAAWSAASSASPPAASIDPARIARTDDETRDLLFRRGLALREEGLPRGAADLLEEAVLSSGGSFPGARRAAALLAIDRLRMGDLEGFARVAREVETWPAGEGAVVWIGDVRAALEWEGLLGARGGLPVADFPEGLRPYLDPPRPPAPLPSDPHLDAGAQSLASHDWEDARVRFGDAEDQWNRMSDLVDRHLDGGSLEQAWRSWDRDGAWGAARTLDFTPWTRAADLLAAEASDLRRPLPAPVRADEPVSASDRSPFPVPPPSVEERRSVQFAEAAALGARQELERAQWDIDRLKEDAARRDRYRARGIEKARTELSRAGEIQDESAAMSSRAEELMLRLQRARDGAIRRVILRTEAAELRAAENRRWTQALDRFYARGAPPDAEAAALLAAEADLAEALERYAKDYGERTPDVIRRSHDELWRPGLESRLEGLAARAGQGRAAEILASLAGAGDEESLDRLMAQRDSLGRRADGLLAEYESLRDGVVLGALKAAREHLDARREGIDYGLCAASYGLALSGPIDPETLLPAVARMEAFLGEHPSSTARADVRFRLADLLLVRARDDFQRSMASFLERQPAGGAVPVLETERAADLYMSILDEEPAFPATDAVLFNAGMLLADQGDPRASDLLRRLIEDHPSSRLRQEASLKMGEILEAEGRFAAAVPHFEASSDGGDASVAAAALYRLGWAHVRQDRHLEGAGAFRRLLDLYGASGGATALPDLRDEAEGHLVEALCRAGGADAFVPFFAPPSGGRPYESRILLAMIRTLRRFSLFSEAAAGADLWLDRYPADPGALDAARLLLETLEAWNRPDLLRTARRDLPPRFFDESPWARACHDSLRREGDRFARDTYAQAGLDLSEEALRLGDGGGAGGAWREALAIYDRLTAVWSGDRDAPRFHFHAGEAARHLGDFQSALDHYEAAASSDTASFAAEAAWRQVVVLDAWYRAEGGDDGARRLLAGSEAFVRRHPGEMRSADALWRSAHVAFAHGWHERAAESFASLARSYAADPRAPRAACLRGDAYLEMGRFETAAAAYEEALSAIAGSGSDSLAVKLRASIPICRYKHAEEAAEKGPGRAAPLFEAVALRWPDFEHADLALYRAGTGAIESGAIPAGVSSLESLLRVYPESPYGRDALAAVAAAWETEGRAAQAAQAYERLSRTYAGDPDAGAALLKAADLREETGDGERARSARLEYVRRFPADAATAMGILEDLAREDLASGRPVSTLLAEGEDLSAYLRMAQRHPDLASPEVPAHAAFLQGEEVFSRYLELRLTQPLASSLREKKELLEQTMDLYTGSLSRGAPPWNHASSHRIGQALVAMGDALMESERPADLSRADRLAYDDVLADEAWAFYDRGEEVWTEALRTTGWEAVASSEWLERTKTALWSRLGSRFLFRPEVEYPASAPGGAGLDVARRFDVEEPSETGVGP